MTIIEQNVDFLQKIDFDELCKDLTIQQENEKIVRYLVLMLDKGDGHFLKLASAIYDLPNMLAATVSLEEPLKGGAYTMSLLGGLSEELDPNLEEIVTQSIKLFNQKDT